MNTIKSIAVVALLAAMGVALIIQYSKEILV